MAVPTALEPFEDSRIDSARVSPRVHPPWCCHPSHRSSRPATVPIDSSLPGPGCSNQQAGLHVPEMPRWHPLGLAASIRLSGVPPDESDGGPDDPDHASHGSTREGAADQDAPGEAVTCEV